MKNKTALTLFCLFLSLWTFAQAPVPNFKSDITGGCAPIVVNFQDLSTNSPTAWTWDFGNGAGSNKQNPSTTYFDEGTYKVTLTASNASGSNTVTKTAYITVYKEPVANFTVSSTTGCTPAHIQFSDVSTSPLGTTVTGWRWDFGDGNSSTQQNPLHTYRTPGSFTVTLTITNDKGCTNLITKPNYVNIVQGVVPSFSNTNPTECAAPAGVQFTNTSSGPGNLSYSWSFGDGTTTTTPNYSHTYGANGTYRVTLAVSSSLGCTDSVTRNIEIGKVNSAFTVPEKICPKAPAQFVNTSAPRPLKVLWQFSDGQTDTLRNPIVSFAKAGTYTVTLTNTFEVCTNSITKTFTVLPAPAIGFNALDTGKCVAPLQVQFSNTTTDGVAYTWNFGDSSAPSTDANPVHNYTRTGDYDVSLIATGANGCRDTLTQKSFIEIKKSVITLPTLPRGGCVPYSTTFEATIASPDPIVGYRWDFGDGNTSNAEKPAHTYSKIGNYNVSLTITTKGGCTETLTLNNAIKVGTLAKPQFTVDKNEGCAFKDIQFTNLTPETADAPLEYLWTFSDSSTSTEKNPLHVFTGTGPIDVTLTAIENGCENQLTKKQFVVVRPAVSRFDYKPNCSNRNEYTFEDKSIGAKSWLWDFGGGKTSNRPNPGAHVFPGPGTYTVKLTTWDENKNCPYQLERQIIIKDVTPDFATNLKETCKNTLQTFYAQVPDVGLIKDYLWRFSDGTTINSGLSNTAYHTFRQAGNYDVTLVTTDTFNCQSSLTKPAFVRINGPKADFTSLKNTGCRGMTTYFTDATVTDGRNSIINWRWDFGDSATASFTNANAFQHRYDTIGDFNVKLVVTDAAGCSDSVTRFEFVKISTLKAAWSVTEQTCPGASSTFRSRTTSDFKPAATWTFGDGNQLPGNVVRYAFKDTGFYSVKMKVRDELGCEDSLYLDKGVYVGLPKAAFDANNFTTYCTPFEAKFINKSTFGIESYWTLGPGKGFSYHPNPNMYYTTTGSYPIKLVVTSPGGCKDSVTQVLNVFNPEDGRIEYEKVEGCRPVRVAFQAFTKMKGQFIWDFGDGTVTDTTNHIITHTYEHLGIFTPKIILIQPEGCKVPLTGKNAVDVIGAKAMFNVNQRLFCDSGTIRLTDSTLTRDPIQSYTWNFSDGTSSTDPKLAAHRYFQPGNYDISLVVATTTGCSDTAYQRAIKVVESPSIRISGDSVICVNDFVNYQGHFNRVDTSVVKWRWTLPNGGVTAVQSPGVHHYPTPGRFSVRAIATNTSGCADTTAQSLVVHALPQATLASPVYKQAGFPLTLPVKYTPGVVGYDWSPANDLSCADCPNPVATPKLDTKYNLAIVDSNGCKNSTTVQVLIFCENNNVFIPNTFSPNGDGSNDVFYVRGKGLERVKSLRIFNRWGQVVFEKRDFAVNDPSVGWDGTFKGARPQPDVYIYQVEVFCENSQVIRYEGNIALIQ